MPVAHHDESACGRGDKAVDGVVGLLPRCAQSPVLQLSGLPLTTASRISGRQIFQYSPVIGV